MGTYTANKNLYMPTVGEQGWGDLMNTNLSTIDTFLKPITVSESTYTFTGNHVGNQSGGTITATKITNSGTSTFTGKITANGGIGTKALTATSISNSGTLTQTGTSTFTGKITANGGVNDYEERIAALEDVVDTTTGTITVDSIIYRNLQTVNVTPSEYIIGRGDPIYILPFRGENVVYAGTLKFKVSYTQTPCIYFYNIDGTMNRYLGAYNNNTQTRTDTVTIPENTTHAYTTQSIIECYVPLFS